MAAPLRMVVVGVSAGGLRALQMLLADLPADWNVPMAIVQHRSRESDALRDLLQDVTSLPVCEIEDKQPIAECSIYVAPPDYHTLVDVDHFALSIDQPVRYSRPSIDVLFESAADAYGSGLAGVVLTGANADGARGLARIEEVGGPVIVQDPADAEVSMMPRSALRAVPNAVVLPLPEIAPYLAGLRARPDPRAGARTA